VRGRFLIGRVRSALGTLPWAGRQRIEAAAAPLPDPPVDRLPRYPHRPPERVDVLTRCDLTYQQATSLRRMRRIRRFPGSTGTETSQSLGHVRPVCFLPHPPFPRSSSIGVQTGQTTRIPDQDGTTSGLTRVDRSGRPARGQEPTATVSLHAARSSCPPRRCWRRRPVGGTPHGDQEPSPTRTCSPCRRR
jgi:hypothetical protein